MRKIFLAPARQFLFQRSALPRCATLTHAHRFCHSNQSNQTPTTTTTNHNKHNDASVTEEQRKAFEKAFSQLSEEDQTLIREALLHPEKQKPSVLGGAGIGPKGGDMAAAFTCGVCEHRMVKRFSKHAYTKGIVIVECANCRSRHLIADNLGWLEDDKKNVEDYLREKGEHFVRITGEDGSVDFVVEPEEEEQASAPSKQLD
ncbi:hypothetical protein AGDE_12563 [Angomonas deanei]|uniref:DNL zinc finger containing protein, putative n=1 Tax=Angomonas deanei TaxID=59799 RepID=A0A7G2CBM9_9TRYP|nr:hypothetical protein AGDE_12563 [Angomonas deanei]CAD2217216.1 DNL zinc finger containing protein, putative [Angomonas deanei]|eukprot:EPY24030.1 hypothetical protein AGDE_12563 [Angomonas deanei]